MSLNPLFPQITSPAQAQAEVIVNQALVSLEHQGIFAYDDANSTGLTWAYLGGPDLYWGGFQIDAGTLSLADNDSNYIVVERSTGIITTSTTNTNWNDGEFYARVYLVTTASGAVSAIEDHRSGIGGVHGPSAFVTAVVGSLDDIGDVDTSGVQDGDVLTYDSGTSEWIAAAPTGGGGISASYVRVQVSNGYGSTNTNIRRFTTSVDSVGTDITYADSAANGASFTVNATGLYSINYCDSFNQAADLGISVNSNQLTTGIQSITDSHRYAEQSTGGNNFAGACSAMAYLTSGDVIRPHTSGSPSGSVTNLSSFIVARIL